MRAINLLPPEAAERSRARRRLLGLLFLGLLYLAALALITLWWQGKATDAEDELAAQQRVNDELQQQVAQLEPFRVLRDDYDAGALQMSTILATDIAWGRLLNDIGRVIPDRTWLLTFNGQLLVVEDQPERLGDLNTTGVAFDYPDASSWLRVLDTDAWPAVGDGWMTTTQVGTIGDVEVVNWTSVASLTVAAASDRAETMIPGVPE